MLYHNAPKRISDALSRCTQTYLNSSFTARVVDLLRIADALLPLYQALICGTCDRLRYGGPTYVTSQLHCFRDMLAQNGTYNLQHRGYKTENGRHYLEILSARSYLRRHQLLSSFLANLTLVLKSGLGMTLLWKLPSIVIDVARSVIA